MTTDLALLAADPGALESAADPGQFVVLACERAKAWLAQALEHGDIESLVETKSQAEAIRVYTAQKQMGHDAELSAAEVVRRAERCIGLAIRKGQEEGSIKRNARHGVHDADSMSPRVAIGANSRSSVGLVYQLTDDVTDEEFDAALDEAKAERNLSRANIVRKVKNAPLPERSEFHHKRRHIDPNRVVEETVGTLDGLCMSLELIDPTQVDPDQVEPWSESLRRSIRRLQRLLKEMNRAHILAD